MEIYNNNISPMGRLFYIHIMNDCNNKGFCDTELKEFGYLFSLTYPNVRKKLLELSINGLIKIDRSKDCINGHFINKTRYFIIKKSVND